MLKLIKILLACVALSFCSQVSSSELILDNAIYSNWYYISEADDCGGYTLTLSQNEEKQLSGLFQVYEGNCDSYKQPIEITIFNRHTREISFKSPSFIQGQDNPVGWYKFKGKLSKNNVIGKVKYCSLKPNFCNESKNIVLKRVKNETP